MSVITTILNAIASIRNFISTITRALSSLTTWIESIIGAIESRIAQIADDLQQMAEADLAYASAIYTYVTGYVARQIDAVTSWVGGELARFDAYIGSVYHAAESDIASLGSSILHALTAFESYVYDTIIKGIGGEVISLLKWVATEGAFIYDLVTHPEKLAALLGKYILGAWMTLGRQFAKPFFGWLYANAISLAPDFASVLEDVISSLFD